MDEIARKLEAGRRERLRSNALTDDEGAAKIADLQSGIDDIEQQECAVIREAGRSLTYGQRCLDISERRPGFGHVDAREKPLESRTGVTCCRARKINCRPAVNRIFPTDM